MDERLKRVLDGFSDDPQAGLQSLRNLLSEDRQAFYTAALGTLREQTDTPAHHALARLLAEKDLLTEALCDPALFPREQAIEIARVAAQTVPILDTKLARRLPDLDASNAERVLAILDVIAEGPRVAPMLRYLLRDANPRLRSKAALLVGRANRNPDWLEQQMREAEPRVRANAIQALWGVNAPGVRSQFCLAVNDANLRVAVNALVGLYKLGDISCLAWLRELASRPGAPERASAAWAMGETGDPRFLPVLHEMNPEPADKVAPTITRALERIGLAQTKRRGGLTLELTRREIQAEGSVRLETAIAGEGWDLIDLKATQVIIWEGLRAVDQYSLRPPDRTTALVLGFAMCGGADVADADVEAARAAVLGCLERKRTGDSWAIVRHVDEVVRYTNDKIALKKLLQAEASTSFRSSSKMDLLSKLAERASVVRGDRHIIVLAGPKAIPAGILPIGQPDPAQILTAARQHKCVIHTVVLGPPAGPHPLDDLAVKTGGMTLRTADSSGLPALYQQACCGLLNRYDICYQRPSDSPGPLRIGVFTDQSAGELSLPPE